MVSLNGCRWQEKSFSVSTIDKEKEKCRCGGELKEVIYKYNGEKLCRECFKNLPSLENKFIDFFYTSRDKLWDFVDDKNFGKTIHITSKRQWKQELKKRGLHDDCVNRPRKLNEIIKNKPEYQSVSRKEIADCIHQELKDQWLHDKLIKRR